MAKMADGLDVLDQPAKVVAIDKKLKKSAKRNEIRAN
jgi:hypothetical protein